jgi:hypothetical protein
VVDGTHFIEGLSFKAVIRMVTSRCVLGRTRRAVANDERRNALADSSLKDLPRTHYFSEKLTVTVMITGTATPLRNVGAYSH